MSGVKERKFGAMDNIYKSVDKLQASILNVKKTLLTEPRPERGAIRGSEVLELPVDRSGTYYHCTKCENWISEGSIHCPSCSARDVVQLGNRFQYKYPKQGYLKENVTFIVRNNLEIIRTSTINTMDVLSKMGVTNLSDLLSINKEIRRKDVSNLHTLNVALASVVCLYTNSITVEWFRVDAGINFGVSLTLINSCLLPCRF